MKELYKTIGEVAIESFTVDDAQRAMSAIPARARARTGEPGVTTRS
jgi:hypothetical protein